MVLLRSLPTCRERDGKGVEGWGAENSVNDAAHVAKDVAEPSLDAIAANGEIFALFLSRPASDLVFGFPKLFLESTGAGTGTIGGPIMDPVPRDEGCTAELDSDRTCWFQETGCGVGTDTGMT